MDLKPNGTEKYAKDLQQTKKRDQPSGGGCEAGLFSSELTPLLITLNLTECLGKVKGVDTKLKS